MNNTASARIQTWIVTHVDEAASMNQEEVQAFAEYLWNCGVRYATLKDLFDFKGEAFHGEELTEILNEAVWNALCVDASQPYERKP